MIQIDGDDRQRHIHGANSGVGAAVAARLSRRYATTYDLFARVRPVASPRPLVMSTLMFDVLMVMNRNH